VLATGCPAGEEDTQDDQERSQREQDVVAVSGTDHGAQDNGDGDERNADNAEDELSPHTAKPSASFRWSLDSRSKHAPTFRYRRRPQQLRELVA